MKWRLQPLTMLLLASAVSGRVIAQPVISSVSPSSAARSGRVLISGSGFGTPGADSHVEIGGATALFTRWTDTLIAAYVPETSPVGTASVQVFVASAPSNTSPLDVTLRQPSGRVKWRFQADSDYIVQRPAVGSDGTVVAHDSAGFVYALGADGGLKWIYKTRISAAGPPAIGADGTVYVADSATITALRPDGTVKWTFDEPQGGQGVMAGPGIGPDGNIYAVTDLGGLGALALSPAGALLWNNPGQPAMQETGQTCEEIAFGPSLPGGPIDRFYVAFDDYTTDAQSHLYAFDLTGNQIWTVGLFASKDTSMMRQQQAAVGPDGTVYLGAIVPIGGFWALNAFDPGTGALENSFFPSPDTGISVPDVGTDGNVFFAHSTSYLSSVTPGFSARWQFFDGGILNYPIVSPVGDQVVTAKASGFGVPGTIQSFDASSGQPLWSVDLGVENGGNQAMQSRSRFTSDGRTVYFGTVIAGADPGDTYCYLYAVDASTSSAAPNAPSNLTAAAEVGPAIALTWADNSGNEQGFSIERCVGTATSCDGSPANYAQIAQTGPNATAYNDGAVLPGTTYAYRTRAFDATGSSAYSNTASASTGAGTSTPGEVSKVGANPLIVTGFNRSNGKITVSYEPACASTDHVAYSGPLAQVKLLQWDRAVCGLGTGGTATFNPGAGDRFFVIVGQDATAEGSYGTRSDGTERPEAVGVGSCDEPQDLSSSCP